MRFSHLDSGTAEHVWRGDARAGEVPMLDTGVDTLVVVAAHPDDESLGAAGLMRRIQRTGGRITVIVATDGEASHPGSPTHPPDALAALRRAEALEAVTSLAAEADVHFLGLPDGGLREHRDELTAAISAILDASTPLDRGASLVVAPWSGDGHRDHRVIAAVVRDKCAERGIRHLGYPIWLWHWGTPDELPWAATRAVALTREELRAKRHALSLHVSQVAPLSPAAGDEAVLQPAMLEHFERTMELFVEEPPPADAAAVARARESIDVAWFERFYERHADPWGFETRWYEQRKRSVLLSALPARHLGEVLEIGCATGLVTRELVARAERVIAIDPVESALDAARTRLAGDTRVTFVRGRMPHDWPGGTFDTIVLSEVGYYLSADDLARTVRLIAQSLRPDGCLIACHWRHPVADHPLTGDEVHAELRAMPWHTMVRHEEPDFLLDVFSPAPALSVAQREGLA